VQDRTIRARIIARRMPADRLGKKKGPRQATRRGGSVVRKKVEDRAAVKKRVGGSKQEKGTNDAAESEKDSG